MSSNDIAGFDDPGLYFQERFFATSTDRHDSQREEHAENTDIIEKFVKFFKHFNIGGFGHIYRIQLRLNCNLGKYHIEVLFDHLRNFDEDLAIDFATNPSRYITLIEEAAKRVVNEVFTDEEDEQIGNIQVSFVMNDPSTSIRRLKSTQVSQLVKVSGIIVAASQVRAKAVSVSIRCHNCHHVISDIVLKPGLDGFSLPRTCGANRSAQLERCPLDPYFIMPDKCLCIDYQTLKLQENPEDVPYGEMPRHIQLYCDRYLTDRVAPGNRVSIVGIYSVKRSVNKQKSLQKSVGKSLSGIRPPYLRVLGIRVWTSGPGRIEQHEFTKEEEQQFRQLSKKPGLYELIANSIAPSIYGVADIKKSVACMLFGGSRKRLPDGLTRRGDINVLLLGDPGTAKSQLLKFVEKVAPVGVYTSGKGSSAAGLTASVIRDPQSRAYIMEGGAMVLADGGVVCIDEFDKMREDDRVAIHEAMEQQTISIAKAGITTTLNSRCSVFAAANSVYGRWDDTKGEENIDFMPTILSRFDMIYIMKDTHDVDKDMTLAKHIISVHVNANADEMEDGNAEGELPLTLLKKYIAYCRAVCGPRLSDEASKKLVHNYVRLRNPVLDAELKQSASSAIPITVRQLEAIVRICEALAKMELMPYAEERHIDEALRLFRVSTIDAASSGSLAGVEGFVRAEDQEAFSRIEQQMKKRFALGTLVSEYLIVQDFVRQNYPEIIVKKVIQSCLRRGDLQYRMQRKMLYRVK